MKLTNLQKRRFDRIIHAAQQDTLCLIQAKHKTSGEIVALVATTRINPDGSHDIFPLARILDEAYPVDSYEPPNSTDEFGLGDGISIVEGPDLL